ncbi:hypothetical protein BDA96_01G144200 [Sorghum bicolor]|uniref:Uncharacterized protein n=2 Tax=Sorghum bicolor TaxID=4558 RepID=A0A921RY40_SORBI|nr:hypothetical protein BDA96_01G144200 [Sorghum bicolor]KXG37854.1 hypothetical protein SORBI_3001G138100 [Sorghum bicolor]
MTPCRTIDVASSKVREETLVFTHQPHEKHPHISPCSRCHFPRRLPAPVLVSFVRRCTGRRIEPLGGRPPLPLPLSAAGRPRPTTPLLLPSPAADQSPSLKVAGALDVCIRSRPPEYQVPQPTVRLGPGRLSTRHTCSHRVPTLAGPSAAGHPKSSKDPHCWEA